MALLRLALALVLVAAVPSASTAVSVGARAPSPDLVALGEDAVGLEGLRGHVVVLDFWATWCPPCVAQLNALNAFAKEHGASRVVVVAASIDDDPETARSFLSDQLGSLDFRAAHDPGGDALADFGADGVPALFVIDGDGVVRATHFGPGCAEGLWNDVEPLLASESLPVSATSPAQ